MTPRQAHRAFQIARARFTAAGLPVHDVQFRIVARHYDATAGARDVAWYDPEAREICLIWAALRRAPATILGVLHHELGHAADAQLDEPGSEARADRIARSVGARVYYDREGLQNSRRGCVARPRWLHQ